MNISIRANHIDITPALREYTEKRLLSLKKFTGPDAQCEVEIGKTTNHHKSGDIFKAECMMRDNGHTYRAESETHDLYAAIDLMQEELMRIASSHKSKKASLWKRGASRIKRMLRSS